MDSGTLIPQLCQRAQNILQKLRLRRREPWNWLLQTVSLALFSLGLLGHSAALLVLSLLGLAAGFLALPLPPMQHTGLRRLVPGIEMLIGLECAWLAKPLDRRKKWQIGLLCLGLPYSCWLLWVQDLAPIGAVLIIAYLLHVRRKNIEQGIDP